MMRYPITAAEIKKVLPVEKAFLMVSILSHRSKKFSFFCIIFLIFCQSSANDFSLMRFSIYLKSICKFLNFTPNKLSMKKLFTMAMFAAVLMTGMQACAQEDKSKRPSPPAKVTEKIKSGATISIDYSQPSVKGRTIGKDLEPKDGKVWRTGANEATVFETDKDVTINGKKLNAGKYGLYSLFNGTTATIIFNKTWNQWGTNYTEADDALRVPTKYTTTATPTEKMTFKISPEGTVSLLWGNRKVDFNVN
jgi:outer membrane lipoprotein-sorting protein